MCEALGDLHQEVVFVGGAVAGFYTNNDDPRPTEDIDLIVHIGSKTEFAKLEEKLRQRGFSHDPGLICRWRLKDLVVDVMPTDPHVLGFSNQWYAEGFQRRISYDLGKGKMCFLLPLPYYLATKIEAALQRGKDVVTSKDLEDIISIMQGTQNLTRLIDQQPAQLKDFLSESFNQVTESRYFNDVIEGNLNFEQQDAHAERIKREWREIASLSKKISH